ncbi:hypothetical protein OIB37_20400 [Streptomyces sp. NBC_00820]|uniref:hypothetical protein n=1 Tax=Streptomyces sp. NBC_00820 TaxID=2975842 RepID=UPI002ED2D58C|nr:hypothetical protein OIB37_20400 [Streptomyces sp. NBC_00820]
MGWTHDYSDAPRNRRSTASPGSARRGSPQLTETDPQVGISYILRRRARWVSIRLRHTRG